MFVHLHCHSRGSFSDSTLKIEDAVEKAASDGQPGLALTDHGMLNRSLSFIELCRKNNIVPIIGSECYFVDSAKDTIRKGDNNRYHLILLAKNKRGLKNLITITNKSWEENCFLGRRGLIDWKLLKKFSKGLICLSGCFWNIVSQTSKNSGEMEAEEKFCELYDIFGADFYSELGRHGVKEEESSNKILIKFSKKYGVKPVVTNDVHYLNKHDKVTHSCFIKSRFVRLSPFSYSGSGYHFKTTEEMCSLGFKPSYLKNTLEILNKCSVDKSSFVRGNNGGKENPAELLDSGCAAFIPEIKKVRRERARHICQLLKADDSVVESLTGQWRELRANLGRVAISTDPPLNEITPVFKWKNLPVCQFSEGELKKQGVFVAGTEKCLETAPLS